MQIQNPGNALRVFCGDCMPGGFLCVVQLQPGIGGALVQGFLIFLCGTGKQVPEVDREQLVVTKPERAVINGRDEQPHGQQAAEQCLAIGIVHHPHDHARVETVKDAGAQEEGALLFTQVLPDQFVKVVKNVLVTLVKLVDKMTELDAGAGGGRQQLQRRDPAFYPSNRTLNVFPGNLKWQPLLEVALRLIGIKGEIPAGNFNHLPLHPELGNTQGRECSGDDNKSEVGRQMPQQEPDPLMNLRVGDDLVVIKNQVTGLLRRWQSGEEFCEKRFETVTLLVPCRINCRHIRRIDNLAKGMGQVPGKPNGVVIGIFQAVPCSLCPQLVQTFGQGGGFAIACRSMNQQQGDRFLGLQQIVELFPR